MADTCSFDITTGCDLQEVDNAVNQALKEMAQRYDFRGVTYEVTLKKPDKKIFLHAPDEFKLKAIWDVLLSKMVRRNVPIKNLKEEEIQAAGGNTVKREITLVQGIETEIAKKIVKYIKESNFKKTQASIQSEQVRVVSPSRDTLQEVMTALRGQDFGIELQFGNYR